MPNESHWKLLAKYLSGQASEREIGQLEEWIKSDPVHRKLLDEAARAWDATKKRGAPEVDATGAWEAVRVRIDEEGAASSGVHERPKARSKRASKGSPRSARRRLLRVAGGMALLLGAAVLVLMWTSSDPKVIATDRGERSSFQLIDGTHVNLNADSKLTLSPGFGQGTRDVRLEGEAYFRVTHVEGRPFRVHTPEGDVHVVGTAFNIHAYASEEQARIAVSEGKVALHVRPSARATQTDTVMLKPRQLGVMADRRMRELRRGVDLRPLTAWKEGRLVFEDAAFSEVVRRLERWYDLQIDVQAPVAAIDQLNAVFEEESVREVISDIAIALDLQFEIQGSHVTFWRRAENTPSDAAKESPPIQNSTLLIN